MHMARVYTAACAGDCGWYIHVVSHVVITGKHRQPGDQLKQTAISISCVHRHSGATDRKSGHAYEQNTCVCEHGQPCGQPLRSR